MHLERIYSSRFTASDLQDKHEVWEVLCADFFQKYIGSDDVVIDLGAGSCEFINNIVCAVRYAVDIREDLPSYTQKGVIPIIVDSKKMICFESDSTDVVFSSNFSEHMRTKDDLIETFREVYRILRPSGKWIILQPNIRYLYREYWDYFDHHIPLSHKSMVEALQSVQFRIQEIRPKFLPYTFKSWFPTHPWLVRLYLKIRILQFLLGKQMFIVAEKI